MSLRAYNIEYKQLWSTKLTTAYFVGLEPFQTCMLLKFAANEEHDLEWVVKVFLGWNFELQTTHH